MKKLIFKIPSNCSEKTIIIKPATILNVCEFCKKPFKFEIDFTQLPDDWKLR